MGTPMFIYSALCKRVEKSIKALKFEVLGFKGSEWAQGSVGVLQSGSAGATEVTQPAPSS